MPSPSLELDGESPLVDGSAGTIHQLPWQVGTGVEELPQLQLQLQLQHQYQLQLQHQHQHQSQYQAQHQYSSPSSYPTWSSPATPAETTVDTPRQFQTPAALPCNSTGYFPQQAYAQLQQDQQGTYRTVEDHPSRHQHLQHHHQHHHQHQHHQHHQQQRQQQPQDQYQQDPLEHTGIQGAIPQQILEPRPRMPTRKRSGPGPTLDVSDKQPKTVSSPRRQRRQTQQQPQKPASQTQQKQPRQQKTDEAKPKKRGRKPKYVPVDPSPPASDDEELQGLDDDDGASLPDGPQRTHVLERNRVAATKCRLRKRDEASALASREQTVEDQNRYLSSCFDSLMSEVLQLKTELLRHTDCGCVLIQRYIAHEAKKTVENMTGVSEQSSQWSDPITTSSRGSVDHSNISPTNPEQGHEYYSLPWNQAPLAHGGPPQMEYYHACSKSQNQSAPSPSGLDPFHGPSMGTLAPDMQVT
ncbi:hypothetical protein S40285_03747 [Stachybotrys chlorohalonatus IBT 40285]|uniref:BZIP domain-containing protein n=1 Tax=Stachybotrys chlorohalonatus (strain IBT 40285) TaxID=1283841 RepID=A0A084QJ04_STAC4|nr:hypothetical protein S40285_03747 [Stachybotrys chlorohalonata IBT 40285]